ncbi:MAG: CPBP family intramembrane metalloprotease [Bdellovibrionales bacterium]|nr:CPBP family intramembrane metalloprotease [Bdellovibrionales bacterium]
MESIDLKESSRAGQVVEEFDPPAKSSEVDSLDALASSPFAQAGSAEPKAYSWFSSRLRTDRNDHRNPFWFPAASFILPGFDQFLEHQNRAGFTYASGAYLGLLISTSASSEIENENELEDEFDGAGDYNKSDDRQKRLLFGGSLYQLMGSLSSYQSFRTAVRSYHNSGSDRFGFLKGTIEEDTGDLLLAPFEVSYFLEPTSWIPLLLVGGIVAYDMSKPGVGDGSISASEGLFLSNISYHAGVGEEAMFRGWLFPYVYDALDNYFWSNTLQAAFFAYLHVTPNYRIPYYQFAFGFYAGYLAKRNNWSLKEAVFVHTWWDIIAFSALFLNEDTRDQAQIQVPLLQMSF